MRPHPAAILLRYNELSGEPRLFDGDPSALGHTLRLNDELVTIVGVMREEFSGVNDTPPDVWVPLTMHAAIVKQDLFGPHQPPRSGAHRPSRQKRYDRRIASLTPVPVPPGAVLIQPRVS